MANSNGTKICELKRELVEEIVGDYSPHLDLISYEIEPGSKLGDGFTADLFALKLKAHNREADGQVDELKLMVKTVPKTEFRKQFVLEIDAFNKETNFYSKILADFEEFQKSKGIPEDEILRHFAKVYSLRYNHEALEDYIAMENLKLSGYVLGNTKGFDLEHCTVVLKNMAKFHAISYAKFGGDYDVIMNTYPFLKDVLFRPPQDVTEFSRNLLGMFCQGFTMEKNILEQFGHLEEAKIIDEIIINSDVFINRVYEMLGKKCPKAIIGLGDVWANNMLFKYCERGHCIVNFKFLDFQICRTYSRAIEVGYFIYTSAELNLLNTSQEKLLSIYHEEFTRFAKLLGVDSTDVALNFDDFYQEFQDHNYFSFINGLVMIPLMQVEKSEIPDMNKIEENGSMESGILYQPDTFKGGLMVNRVKDFVNLHWPAAKKSLEKKLQSDE